MGATRSDRAQEGKLYLQLVGRIVPAQLTYAALTSQEVATTIEMVMSSRILAIRRSLQVYAPSIPPDTDVRPENW